MGRYKFPNSRSAARNGAELTPFPGQEDPRALTTPLKRDPAGPKAKVLVENVISALEQGSDCAAHLEALKPQLDLLIKMSEDMAAAMKSQVHVCDQARAQALLKIGDCNVKKQALEETLEKTNANIARDTIAAAEDQKKIQAIDDEMEKIRKKIAENGEDALNWSWVPGYGLYNAIRNLKETSNILLPRREQAKTEQRSAYERLRAMEAVVSKLGSEKYDMECEVYNLKGAINLLDRKSKAYARRLTDFKKAKMFYRLLSNAIENLQDSLSLPRIVEQLLVSTELVLITGDQAGQQKQSTLKELLIHLGGEYDHYLENGLPEINDGVARADSSFQYKIAPLQVGPLFGKVSTYPTWPTSKL